MTVPRVAIVGAGPAGFYAAEALAGDADVNLFDRLPTIGGLVRAGVAPDHHGTKQIVSTFTAVDRFPGVTGYFNVDIGRDLTVEELLEHHHAVLVTVGASGDRRLGIPGEELPGSHSATEFVAWYNGHPDFRDRSFNLSTPRAVVIGNGNVALDVARMLLLPHEALRRTDIADHALDALGTSDVEEVLLLGRRGSRQAAFTAPELHELGHLPGVDVIVDPADLEAAEDLLGDDSSRPARYAAELKHRILSEYAAREPRGGRRLVLRFLASPLELRGEDRVERVLVARNELVDGRARSTEVTEEVECGLVLRSVGFRGRAVDGVPFDENRGVIPNVAGRVEGATGMYVAGWIKRGPTGVIGTNRIDALETVRTLLADFEAGRLPDPPKGSIDPVVTERCPDRTDFQGWRRIDAAERAAGTRQRRPRRKLTDPQELLAAANAE